jgi:hypothetical protein
MYKIKIFSDFCSSEKCKLNFEKVFNAENCEFYGESKQIYITNQEDYTHAIILNTSMPEITIPKENVIGLAFEPRELLDLTEEFINYAKIHIGKYLIGNNTNLPNLFIEHYSFMWHNNPNRPIPVVKKNKKMSIVFSDKNLAPGHLYRTSLVNEILREKLPIDIYGSGCRLINDRWKYENVKGRFESTEPYDEYLFSICIENYQSNDYISEKILDPLFHNCNPIYLGAKNIKKYFDNIILLKRNILFDIEMLKVILKSPQKYYKQTNIERNLRQINFFENILQYFIKL